MTQDNGHSSDEQTKEFKNMKQELARSAPTRVSRAARQGGPKSTDKQPAKSLIGKTTAKRKQAVKSKAGADQGATAAAAKSGSSSDRQPKSSERTRSMPTWLYVLLRTLRILLVPALCAVALYLGLRIGYVTFGDQNPEDIWEIQTWRHLYDLVFADDPTS